MNKRCDFEKKLSRFLFMALALIAFIVIILIGTWKISSEWFPESYFVKLIHNFLQINLGGFGGGRP